MPADGLTVAGDC